MRTYKTQLLTSAIPTFYPDDPPASAGVVTPPLPVEGQTALESAEPPKEEPKAGDPPKEEPKKEEPKAGDPPKEEPKKEEPPAAAAVPEAYELKVEIDGKPVDLDPEAVKAATPIFKAAGLTNDQAQAVVGHYATDVLPGVAQTVQMETLRLLGMDGMASWAADLKADKELGGANYDKNLTLIAAGRDAFATPELRTLLETSRLGNHPEIARLFYKLGKATAEGGVHKGDVGTKPTTPEAILYGQEYQPKA